MTENDTKITRQQVLLTLDRNNGNIAQTARDLNVTPGRIRRWRDEAERLTLDDLERTFLVHAAVLAGDLLTGEVVNAPLNQRASALGMLVDRLLKLEARREAKTPDTPAAEDDDDGPLRLVYRDRHGNLRDWGDWDDEEDDHAPDA